MISWLDGKEYSNFLEDDVKDMIEYFYRDITIENDKFLLKKNDNGTNALLMIGGLPPKSLKQCKKSFESALNDIVQLVQLINQIKS